MGLAIQPIQNTTRFVPRAGGRFVSIGARVESPIISEAPSAPSDLLIKLPRFLEAPPMTTAFPFRSGSPMVYCFSLISSKYNHKLRRRQDPFTKPDRLPRSSSMVKNPGVTLVGDNRGPRVENQAG